MHPCTQAASPAPDGADAMPPFALDPEAIAAVLDRELGRLLLGCLGNQTALTVGCLPSLEDARAMWGHNGSLFGEIRLAWSGSAEAAVWRFPVPAHGVFVKASPKRPAASLWTWHPWLVSQPGLWRLRMGAAEPGQERPKDAVLRVAFRGGHTLDLPWDGDLTLKKVGKAVLRLSRALVLPPPEAVPEDSFRNLHLFASQHACVVKGGEVSVSDLVPCLWRDLEALRESHDALPCLDEPDLAHQRLFTYSAYVIDRVLETVARALKGEPPGEVLWSRLCKRKLAIHWGELLPAADGGRSRRAPLRLFDPLNAVEAVSQLTAFDRYGYGPDALGRVPMPRRQNHPSYAGVVCPVETPESDRIGITLHLVQGAGCDAEGRLRGVPEEEAALSHAAAHVPFYAFNDAARSGMGAKNLKQALPVREAARPAIATGLEDAGGTLLAPLRAMGVLPEAGAFDYPGRDLLVAYLPWYGWNYEDAIVANRRLASEGLLDFECAWSGERPILHGWQPTFPDGLNDFERELAGYCYADDGLLRPGVLVAPDTVLGYFRGPDGAVLGVTALGGDAGGRVGVLDSIAYVPPTSFLETGLLRWTVRMHMPFGVGDKLMGRHGNKGVVSKLCEDAVLPRLPEDERLGALSGRAVDLVLNPHGVVSRMNLGQLVETQAGLLNALGHRLPAGLGGPWRLDAVAQLPALAQAASEQLGGLMDPWGRIHLVLPDGSRTEHPVTVGFQYFVRLDHAPAGKAAARGRGDRQRGYHRTTGQAVRSDRPGDKPQRLGEMEMWALAAHGAKRMLDEVLQRRSDAALLFEDPAAEPSVRAAIRAHLDALGADLSESPSGWTLRALDDAAMRAGRRPLESSEVWRAAVTVDFTCPRCEKVVLRQMTATRATERAAALHASVADALAHHGLAAGVHTDAVIAAPAVRGATNASTIDVRIPARDDGQTEEQVVFNIARTRSSVTVRFALGGVAYAAFEKLLPDASFEAARIPALRLVCSKHASVVLEPSAARTRPEAVPGGLADGGRRETQSGRYMALPVALPHPLAPGAKVQTLPVLPLRYRYPIPVPRRHAPAGGYGFRNDLTAAYAKLADAVCAPCPGEKAVEEAYGRLVKRLHARLFGKDGLLRRAGLGRRVDYSGRFVVAPDPELAWDECGVPMAALAEWLGGGVAAAERVALDAYWRSGSTAPLRDDARVALSLLWKRVALRASGDWRVVLNRQPSLHRYNMLAFRVKPLPPEDGLVLRINPLVCAGMNADFDGDTVAVHFFAGEGLGDDLADLSPVSPRNLLSLATGEPVAGFNQDFVLGVYLAARAAGCAEAPDAARSSFAKALEARLRAPAPDLPDWLCGEMRKAFDAATRAGVSFGYLELRALAGRVQAPPADVSDPNPALDAAAVEAVKPALDAAPGGAAPPGFGLAAIALSGARGKEQLRHLVAGRGYLSPGEIAFDAEPGDFVIGNSLAAGIAPCAAFMSAMNSRSTLMDKKLITPKAGYLCRRLVLACWPWYVEAGDCGAAGPRSPVSCKWGRRQRLCTGCYGEVPGYSAGELDGFPAGLVAAQSFGERGTQLTMRSYHAAQRQVSLDEVIDLLDGRGALAKELSKRGAESKFVKYFRDTPAYAALDERHLLLIWRVLFRAHRGLGPAWESTRPLLGGLAGEWQRKFVAEAMARGPIESAPPEHPMSRLLIGLAPAPAGGKE